MSWASNPIPMMRFRPVRGPAPTEETADVQVQSHIAHGNAAARIGRFADRPDVDLVVLAARGPDDEGESPFGTVGKRALGSVTCLPFLLCTPAGAPWAVGRCGLGPPEWTAEGSAHP